MTRSAPAAPAPTTAPAPAPARRNDRAVNRLVIRHFEVGGRSGWNVGAVKSQAVSADRAEPWRYWVRVKLADECSSGSRTRSARQRLSATSPA